MHVRAQWRVRQFDVVLCCRDGLVSIQEYMAFMISRETENVQSAQDVEAAFRALTSSDRPFITSQELYAVSHTRVTSLMHLMCTVSNLDSVPPFSRCLTHLGFDGVLVCVVPAERVAGAG